MSQAQVSNGAVATTQAAAPPRTGDTVGDLLISKRKQLEAALPKHMSVDRLLRICMTEITKTPDLRECSSASLLGAILQAAQLGLEPGSHLGHCYLIPFKNGRTGRKEVQFVAGYKGLIDLARRSGKVTSIVARVVYSEDKYEYAYGLDEKLVHVPARGERGEMVAVYAVAVFKDGSKQFEWMWKEDIEVIRRDSKSGNSGPWSTDYDEMAKKTAVRRLCKYLPASPELQTAATLDEYAERGVPQGMAAMFQLTDGTEPAVEPEPTARVAAVISKPAAAPAPEPEVQGGFASFGGAPPAQPKVQPRAPQVIANDIFAAGKTLGYGAEKLEQLCVEQMQKNPDQLDAAELEEFLGHLQGLIVKTKAGKK